MSIHKTSVLLRSLAATADGTFLRIGQPRRLVDFVKSWIKFPVEYRAGQAHQAVPAMSFADLFGTVTEDAAAVTVDHTAFQRHGWNVKLHEEIFLAAAVHQLKPKTIFEIGTFDGNTTRRLAEAAPYDAKIYTMDLPVEMFDATQGPSVFNGSRVGERFADSRARNKIHQIRADATTFDFSPYQESIDFIFVDAAHDYSHGLIDSRNAMKMIRPGGTIIWHDFEPYWSGLIHAICEATAGQPLRRLAGTSMAVLRTAQ